MREAVRTRIEHDLLRRRAALRRLREGALALEEEALAARPPDLTDRATGVEEAALLDQLSETEYLELRAIEAALHRLRNSGYGECESCGEDISEKRLIAVPEALVCIDCAQIAEERASPIRGH